MQREQATARAPHRGREPGGSARFGMLGSVGLAGASVALLLVGCSSGSTTSAGSTVPPLPPVVTTAPSTAPDTAADSPADSSPATSAPASSVAPVEDPAAVLTAAFDDVAPGYHFETSAVIDDQEVASAIGDRVADGTRLTVSSSGSELDYLITPAGAWVSVDAEWEELDQPPITDPVTPLRSPSTLEIESQEGSVVTLIGTYPPAALSLTGDEPVAVRFVIDDATLQQISYRAETAEGPAEVVATISALVDTTPISGPSV